jgi:uncharacterized protein (TIGR02145 family)
MQMKRKNTQLIHFTISIALLVFFQSCKKKDDAKPSPELMQVIDADGNGYRAIKIGNKWWMAENLKVTRYQDHTPIKTASSDDEWISDTAGVSYAPSSKYGDVGLLYNYYAVRNKKNIAPVGWHIPSDEEWKELERNLGMSAEDADKTSWRGTDQGEQLMKARDGNTIYWEVYSDVWPTNESGFTAMAGACRMFDGSKGDDSNRHSGFWWSSTMQGNEVWYRYLDYKNKNVFRYHGSKTYGFSVRCVKD